MNKTDISKILLENCDEAQKLVWKHGKPCEYPFGNMREIELPNGGVDAIIGVDEGKVTKVRTWEDGGMEYYYEAETDDRDYVDSGWTLECDLAYCTANDIHLAIGDMFNK
jgi:hypothetical protein